MRTSHTTLLISFGLALAIALPSHVVHAQPVDEELMDGYKLPDPVKLKIDFASIAAADELERAGDTEGALAILERAALDHPDDGTVIAAMGAIHVRYGDLEQAEAFFQRAADANTDDPSGFAGLCYISVVEGKQGLATDRCNAARNRNIVDPVYGKITVAAEMMVTADMQFADVLPGTLDSLISAYPYVPAGRLLSLKARLDSGNFDAVRGDLVILRQMFEPEQSVVRLIDLISAFRVADVVGADVSCLLSLAALQLREHDGKPPTIQDLERLVECRPDDESIVLRLVEHYNTEGVTARNNADLPSAVEAFRAGLAIAPDDTTLLNNLAYAAIENNDVEGAHEALSRLMELTPDDPQVRKNYGVTLMMLGREEEGRPYIEEAQKAAEQE
jgi:Flp pilus assembly protein TadD